MAQIPRRTLIAPALACLMTLIPAGLVQARLNRSELSSVAVTLPPNARVPLDVAFEDAAGRDGAGATTLGRALGGRPGLLLPVDYTCGNVCDPMLTISAAALQATGLQQGEDVRFVLVGLDPKDGVEAARRMLEREWPENGEGVAALVGPDTAIAALTGALGYGFRYDPGSDSYAHPAAAMIVTGDGRVARVLSPLALNGSDLRLALVEAGEGRVGTVADRFVLLCYGFDAATGVYTPLIRRILSVAAALTVLVIALGLVLLSRRQPRA